MKKTKTIDLTAMPQVHIDEETNAFRPAWDNTILLTAYDASRTFVLTWDGRQLVLGQPLREVLSRFADDNDIAEYERQALYDLVGVRKGRGYVAGHLPAGSDPRHDQRGRRLLHSPPPGRGLYPA